MKTTAKLLVDDRGASRIVLLTDGHEVARGEAIAYSSITFLEDEGQHYVAFSPHWASDAFSGVEKVFRLVPIETEIEYER